MMAQLSIMEMLVRTIPEGIIMLLACYVFSGSKPDVKKILISGMFLGVCTYLVRLLPVHFGVHMIVLLMIYIFLSVKVNGIEMFKAVTAVMFAAMLLIICEAINVFVVTKLFHVPESVLLTQSSARILYGLPSFLLFLVIVTAVMFIKKNKMQG